MPTLVYSLERDSRVTYVDVRSIGTDSLIAIATALAGERDVRYLQLTEQGAQFPMFSVTFPSERLMTTCNARIEHELSARGLRIRRIHVIEDSTRPGQSL